MNNLPLSLTPKLVIFVRLLIGLVTICILLVGIPTPSFAQKTDTNSLLKEANKLFEEGDYAEAYPLFTQLLSIRKGDPDINYKYGATLLYASEKKADAIPYLKKSSSRTSTDIRVFYFLGKAYQLNYEFDLAIKAYTSFKEKADSKLVEEFDVNLSLDQCRNGKQLLSQIKDVLVISRKDVDAEEFFRYYELENLAGRILVAPETFQSSLDKKKGHRSIIYSTPLSNIVYFSSYGKKGDQGTDIYYATRKGDATWTEPIRLPSTINTPFNEDYPFMHPDGKTLYFCSEGHNSMGGFDIFRSQIDLNNGLYSSPENLDFAINTPDDDLLYIADSLNQNAFFASSRASKQGELSVYQVKVDLVPSSIILLKGQFISELDPSLKNARITIEDAQSKRQIGVFQTENDGSYLLDFSYGGAYNFYVEPGKSGVIHTGKVEIPRLESIAAFRQELIMIDNDGKEMLMIKNYFEEELDENVQELLAIALRKRANLEVTPEDLIDERLREQELQEANESFDDLYIAAGLTTFHSNNDVADWSKEVVVDLKENNDEYKALSSKAYAENIIFQNEANALINEAQEKFDQFENSTDPIEKQKLLKSSITLRNEAKVKLLNSNASMMLSKRLNESIDAREKLINEIQNTELTLRKGLEENDAALVQTGLEEISILKKKSKENRSGTKSPTNYLADVKEIEKKKAMQAYDMAEGLRAEKSEQVSLLKRLQTQQNNAKKSEKEKIATEIEITQSIISRIDVDSPKKWKKYRELDWNSKAAEIGLDYATNWNYDQSEEALPDENQIISSGNQIDNAQESILAMELLENDALVSLGVSYDELMSKQLDQIVSDEETGLDSKKEDVESTFENSFVSDYDNKISSIEENPVVLDRLEATIVLKAEVLREVNRNLESNDSNYSEEELKSNKARLEEETVILFSEFKQSIESQQETLMGVSDFIPDYDQQVEDIEKVSSTELENKSNRVDHFNSSISYLTLILDSINLMPIPQYDPYLMRQQIERLNALKIIITELKIERYELQRNVELLSQIAEIPEDDEMITSLDKNYLEKWEGIENSNSINSEKNAQKIQLNESLISKINEEIIAVNSDINNSGSTVNPVLNKRLEILEGIKLQKENEINIAITAMSQVAEEEDPIVDEQKSFEQDINEKKALIALVMPKFDQEMTAIELSDMPDEAKDGKKQALNLELSRAIDGYIGGMSSAEKEGTEYESLLALQNEYKAESDVAETDVTTSLLDESEVVDNGELFKEDKSTVDDVQNVLSAYSYISTKQAMSLFSIEGKILSDPGFTSANLKNEAKEHFSSIQEVNDLHDQFNSLELKENNAADSEKKKIRKEKEKVQGELGKKEIELLEKWIPLIHVENEDNLGDDNYLKLSKQVFAEASGMKGEEKLSKLREAYLLSLMALESGQSQLVDSNPSRLIPVGKGHEKGYNYDNLLVEEKRLVLERNIENLRSNILEAETKVADLRGAGVDENNEELIKWVEISKSYQEALVWNQSKLENIHSLESSIENNAIKQVSSLKAPTDKLAFEKSLSKIGLEESQTEIITSDPEIQTYFAMKYIENEITEEINKLRKMSSSYRDIAGESLNNYDKFIDGSAASSSEAIREYDEKEKIYNEAILWYNKTDSVDLMIAALEKEQRNLNNNIDAYYNNLEAINKQTISDINQGITPVIIAKIPVLLEENNDEPIIAIEEVAIPEEEDEPVFNEPEVTVETQNQESSDGFMYEVGIVFYTEEDPIPVNPPLPSGLIFKVQIGAFRNPLPIEHFVGLSPLMAEELNNGITRYSVGIFNEIEEARSARTKVQGLGYNDAFIVAFLNGERIAINRALEMIGEGSGGYIANDNQGRESNQYTEDGIRNAELIAEGSEQNQRSSDDSGLSTRSKDATVTSVEAIEHLFFCVQVGVFSRRVQSSEIFDIWPLNVEETGSGYFRYTSGQFSSLSEAGQHKQVVISKGVTDAFVTAYYQGQRISVNRASALSAQDPSILLPPNSIAVEENNETIEEQIVEETPSEVIIEDAAPLVVEEKEDLPPAQDVRFVVYIGSYPGDIPNNVASALLEYSYVGIKRVVNSGNTIYSTKELKTFNEATIILQNFQERGIEQAKMLYVLYDKEIQEVEAYKILGQ